MVAGKYTYKREKRRAITLFSELEEPYNDLLENERGNSLIAVGALRYKLVTDKFLASTILLGGEMLPIF